MARSSHRSFAPGGNSASDSRKARIPFVTAAGFQGISHLRQSSQRNSLKVASRPFGPASVTHSGLIARLPISPVRNYLLIEKWKAVSPGRPTTSPNAPRVTSMLAGQNHKAQTTCIVAT
jgi:hypothetical protein